MRMNNIDAAVVLATIIGRIAKINRDSKLNHYTDTDQVWETFAAIKADAQSGLRMLRTRERKALHKQERRK